MPRDEESTFGIEGGRPTIEQRGTLSRTSTGAGPLLARRDGGVVPAPPVLRPSASPTPTKPGSPFRVTVERSAILPGKALEDVDRWSFQYGTIELRANVEYVVPPGTAPADWEVGFIQNVHPSSVVRYRYAHAAQLSSIVCPGQLLDARDAAAVWVRTTRSAPREADRDAPVRTLTGTPGGQAARISLVDTPNFRPCKFARCRDTDPPLVQFEVSLVMQTWIAARRTTAPPQVLGSYQLLAATDHFVLALSCTIGVGPRRRPELPPGLEAKTTPQMLRAPSWRTEPPFPLPVIVGRTANDAFVQLISSQIATPPR